MSNYRFIYLFIYLFIYFNKVIKEKNDCIVSDIELITLNYLILVYVSSQLMRFLSTKSLDFASIFITNKISLYHLNDEVNFLLTEIHIFLLFDCKDSYM